MRLRELIKRTAMGTTVDIYEGETGKTVHKGTIMKYDADTDYAHTATVCSIRIVPNGKAYTMLICIGNPYRVYPQRGSEEASND